MTPTPRPVVIDAQSRGPRGLSALDRVRGRSVLEHLVEIVSAVADSGQVAILADRKDRDALSNTLGARNQPRFIEQPIAGSVTTLHTDRLYNPSRLRRAIRKGGDPESAVIWRLDSETALRGADDEYQRRLTYQPLGRFWAIAPARRLARSLAPTFVRPNMVTLASAATMFSASATVAFGSRVLAANLAAAALLALGLILDTSDGHLARLQGTTSEFGRWLDSWLDEVCDMALHMAIAWSAYANSGYVGWLMMGMMYGMGKLIFMVGVNEWKAAPAALGDEREPMSRSVAADLIRLMGHADLRWHLWIVLAVIGQLPAALAAYTLYYPSRAILGALRKGVRHG